MSKEPTSRARLSLLSGVQRKLQYTPTYKYLLDDDNGFYPKLENYLVLQSSN